MTRHQAWLIVTSPCAQVCLHHIYINTQVVFCALALVKHSEMESEPFPFSTCVSLCIHLRFNTTDGTHVTMDLQLRPIYILPKKVARKCNKSRFSFKMALTLLDLFSPSEAYFSDVQTISWHQMQSILTPTHPDALLQHPHLFSHHDL